MDIRADIKRKREQLGETRAEFAARFGASKAAYARWTGSDKSSDTTKTIPKAVIDFCHTCNPTTEKVIEIKLDKKHRKEVYREGYLAGIEAASIEQKLGSVIRDMIRSELNNALRRKSERANQIVSNENTKIL